MSHHKSTHELKDRELFDRIALRYARKDMVFSSAIARQHQLEIALRPIFAETPAVDTILDVACGVGAPAKILRPRYRRYVGLDHSLSMIQAARRFNEGNSQAMFVVANIKDAPLKDKMADLILAVGALHHMIDLETVIQSIARLAKPGAYFVAIEPSAANPVFQFLRRVRALVDADYSPDQRYFGAGELSEVLKAGGLKQISITHHGFLVPLFAQVIIGPQMLSRHASRAAITIDCCLEKGLPLLLRRLSWNLVVRGRF